MQAMKNLNSGFTLVELSIVLVIVGLLIGGILVGQSLIESAQVNRLARDLGQYEAAITQFDSRYRVLPGDDPYFAPAGAPDNILSIGDSDGDGLSDQICIGDVSNDERSFFWAHLSQASMLSVNFVPRVSTGCGASESTPTKFNRPVVNISGIDVDLFPQKPNSLVNLALQFDVPYLAGLSLVNKLGGQPRDSSVSSAGLYYNSDASGDFVCLGLSNSSGPGVGGGAHSCEDDGVQLDLTYYIEP